MAPPAPFTSVPCTPVQGLNARRRLHPSPSFSDYFSGEGEEYSSPISPPNGATAHQAKMALGLNLEASPAHSFQRILLARLQDAACAVHRIDITTHAFQVLNQDIDRLERTIAAPDAQTREPADVADSGLFVDDESDELDEPIEEEQEPKAVDAEFHETIARVSRVSQDLRQRYEEIKHINDLATEKLEACAEVITDLRDENAALRDDLAQGEADMLYLKLQMKSLEVRAAPHMTIDSRINLLNGIERWKADWKDANTRIKDAKIRIEDPFRANAYSRGTDVLECKLPSTEEELEAAAENKPKYIISRKSKTAVPSIEESKVNGSPMPRHSATSEALSPPMLEGNDESLYDKRAVLRDHEESASDEEVFYETEDGSTHEEEDSEGEETEDHKDSKPEAPTKSALEELWEGLTAFAGMHMDLSD